MSKVASRPDWADDVSDNEPSTELPAPTTTLDSKTGIKTTITYRYDDQGRKVKSTRKTKAVTHIEKVNPAVAERRGWKKFGLSKNEPAGPQTSTTTVGENIILTLSTNWKAQQAEDAKAGGGKAEEKSLKEQLKDKKVKCRICQGEHFTARCPFKDTMAPADDGTTPAADPMAEDGEPKQGGLGVGGSSYVPPHMRKGAAGAGERMGGKYERDDLATLRVTNVSISQMLTKIAMLTCARCLRWPKNKSYETSSREWAESQESSLRRIVRQVGRRALRLSASWTELMLPWHVTSSMGMAISI